MLFDIAFLFTVIDMPLWLVLLTPLGGAVIGMLFLSMSLFIVERSNSRKVVRSLEKLSKDIQVIVDRRVSAVLPVTSPVAERNVQLPVQVKSSDAPQASTMFGQKYRYTVHGINREFGTLREALSALGVKTPERRRPDWQKLPKTVRSRIDRVAIDNGQPLPKRFEQVATHEEEATSVSRRQVVEKIQEIKRESEPVSGKSMGNGAVITITKKKRK